MKPASNRHTRALSILITLAILVLLSNLFAVGFVSREATLYTADHVAYWSLSADLAARVKASPFAAMVAVSQSVAERELNLLPAAPIAAVMVVAGSSRMTYILAVLNLYAIPALCLLFVLTRRLQACEICGPETSMASTLWASALTVLLLPVFWFPVFLGYLGVGGVILALATMAVYLTPANNELSTKSLAAVGFLLAMLCLFRRWYAIWAVAFGLVITADALACCLRAWSSDRNAALRAARKPLIIGTTTLATLTLLALPRLVHIIASDYADRFAAYKVHASLAAEMLGWARHFGSLSLALCAVCAAGLLIRGESRRLALMVLGQLFLCFLLMRRIQDPSPQHWYLYLPGMMALTALYMARWLSERPTRPARRASVAALLAVGLLVSGWTVAATPDALKYLLPGPRIRPQIRTDLLEVHRLLASLDRLNAAEPGLIYIVGATTTMSDTGLAFANMSLGTEYRSPSLMVQTSHVDRRDGFPANLLVATYAVVTSPIQCRRPAVDQRVVELPGESLLEGLDIGQAFRRLPEAFRLQGGVTAYVYQRVRPFTAEEIQGLVARLREAYPDRPEVFTPPGF